MPKQNSRKVRFAGIEFDSLLEKERYRHLLSLEQEGVIEYLACHPKFIVAYGSTLPVKEGLRPKKRIRSELVYTADFEYIYKATMVVEDVKGAYTRTKGSHKKGDPIVTPASKLRMNIIQRNHPHFVLVMVTRPTWWWGEIGGHKLL